MEPIATKVTVDAQGVLTTTVSDVEPGEYQATISLTIPEPESPVEPPSTPRFKDLWRSHNRLNTQAGSKVMNELLNELSEFLNSNYPGDIEVPYRCEAWSAI